MNLQHTILNHRQFSLTSIIIYHLYVFNDFLNLKFALKTNRKWIEKYISHRVRFIKERIELKTYFYRFVMNRNGRIKSSNSFSIFLLLFSFHFICIGVNAKVLSKNSNKTPLKLDFFRRNKKISKFITRHKTIFIWHAYFNNSNHNNNHNNKLPMLNSTVG